VCFASISIAKKEDLKFSGFSLSRANKTERRKEKLLSCGEIESQGYMTESKQEDRRVNNEPRKRDMNGARK
jgi:hypothetical protein